MYSFDQLFDQIIGPALGETLYMTFLAVIFSLILGFIMSILLILSHEEGLRPHALLYSILDIVINICRSLPFIILAVSITPFTRSLVGTSVGPTAAVVPLVVAGGPMLARLFENSMREVNASLIEAARSFGASNGQILRHVVVKEAFPSLVMDLVVGTVSIVGFSAAAGAVGAGGLGAVGITYGYQSYNDTIMWSTVLLLILLTTFIQWVGQKAYKKLK